MTYKTIEFGVQITDEATGNKALTLGKVLTTEVQHTLQEIDVLTSDDSYLEVSAERRGIQLHAQTSEATEGTSKMLSKAYALNRSSMGITLGAGAERRLRLTRIGEWLFRPEPVPQRRHWAHAGLNCSSTSTTTSDQFHFPSISCTSSSVLTSQPPREETCISGRFRGSCSSARCTAYDAGTLIHGGSGGIGYW